MSLTADDVERDLKRLLAISNATLAIVRRLAERLDLDLDAEIARLLDEER